jgi:ATP-dependent helicase/DNAse subunit B
MSTQVLLAPAGAGKTAYTIQRAMQAARSLQTPWVIVPSANQVRALRQRLAGQGGALGVQAVTFPQFYKQLLNMGGRAVSELGEPVRHRLLRATVDALCDAGQIVHYAALRTRPGFAAALGELIRELKQGMIRPSALAQALADYAGGGPRLDELATIYQAYQKRLQEGNWADNEGLGWLAAETLRQNPQLARGWPLVLVDGFDSLNTIQLAILACLGERVGELTITMTGELGRDRPTAHARFQHVRAQIASALLPTVHVLDLPDGCSLDPAIRHLESALFEPGASPLATEAGSPVELLETPDRAAEAREALRWCKARIVQDGMAPGQVALLARSLDAYRPFLLDIAREFGLPVRLTANMPLAESPLIQALLEMLRLPLPLPPTGEWTLKRQRVVETWRSPYLDWTKALAHEGEGLAIDLAAARSLDDLARRGLVIQGLAQWRQAFADNLPTPDRDRDNDDEPESSGKPEIAGLRTLFEAFVRRITPPAQGSYQEYVAWLEDLLGDDPQALYGREERDALGSLDLMARLSPEANSGDRQALLQFADILRGLVWAEKRLGSQERIDYPRFVAELEGAIQAATYQLAQPAGCEDLLLASLHEARGLSFRAVAMLGLAEGEFPRVQREDLLLRETDRAYLQERGLSIDLRLQSNEPARFYEGLTRGRERLLLTRPRLADDGAPWEPSPYWAALCPLANVQPVRLGGSALQPELVASEGELFAMAAASATGGLWVGQEALSADWDRVLAGSALFHQRSHASAAGPYDGDLSAQAAELAERRGADRPWSTSRLESYLSCPFSFFVGSLLGLKARVEPTEGYDAAQRGSIMHAILERLYREQPLATLDERLASLEQTARQVLEQAPKKYGFRATAWWEQVKEEIVALLRQNLVALAEIDGHGQWTPSHLEAHFGRQDSAGVWQPALVIARGGETLRLTGIIDRIDVNAAGQLRIIDYKSGGGGTAYGPKGLEQGDKIQLPLYALAAAEALGLGQPVDGFYWHLNSVKQSSLTLAKEGYESTCEQAAGHAWRAVDGARAGRFVPTPPTTGCADWCPAAAFCWHYQPRSY